MSTLDTQTDTLQLMPFLGEEVVAGPTATQEARLERHRQQMGKLDSLPSDLVKQQREDSTFVHYFKEAEKDPSITSLSEQFLIENDLLYRQSDYGRQLVLPVLQRGSFENRSHSLGQVT